MQIERNAACRPRGDGLCKGEGEAGAGGQETWSRGQQGQAEPHHSTQDSI